MQDEGLEQDGTPNQQGNTSTMWGMVGAVSGGALGFIVGNVPGLLAGAVAGNRLGAIRDTKGKSVYEVFQVRHKLRTTLLRISDYSETDLVIQISVRANVSIGTSSRR